jgi:hypothetical protein
MARKSLGNNTLTYNSNNITAYLTGTDMTFNGKKIDVTDLADTAQNFLTVDGEWKISCEFMWDNALDAILGVDAVTFGTKRTLAYATIGTGATITYTWTSNAEIGDYKFGSKTGDVIKGSCTFTCSGAPTRT